MSETGDARPDESRVRHRAWLLLLGSILLGGLLLYGCADVWLAPVQVALVVEQLPPGARAAVSDDAGTSLVAHLAPLPAVCQLRVTATGRHDSNAAGAAVILTPLVNQDGGRANPEGYQAGPRWELGADGARWSVVPVPDKPTDLLWSGLAVGTLRSGLLAHPEGGIAVLQWDDEAPTTVDTYSPDTRWIPVEKPVPVERAKLVVRVPYGCRHVDLRLTDGSAVCRRSTLVWGERTLADQRVDFALGPDATMVPVLAPGRARLILWAAQNALGALGRGAASWGFCLLVGLPLVMLVRRRLGLIECGAVALAGGSALGTVGVATLVWLGLSGTAAFCILLAGGAVTTTALVAIRVIRGVKCREPLRPPASELRTLVILLVVGMATSLVMFFPLFSFPTWFLGQAYTDSYHYFNFAEAFRTAPAGVLLDPAARAAGHYTHLVQGEAVHLDRTGDVLSLLNAALAARCGARAAYAQYHLNYWLMLPLIAYALLGRLVTSAGARWAGVLLVATSANLYALFTQCYLAHFTFVLLLLFALLIASLYLAEVRRGGLRLGRHCGFVLLVALTLAGQIVTYPGQCLFPAVLALVLLGQALHGRSWRRVGMLVGIAVATAVFCNYTLCTLARFDVQQPLAALDGLARGVVFPFYKDPLWFSATILGLADWVQVSHLARPIGTALSGSGALWTSLLIKPLLPVRLLALFAAVPLTVLGFTRPRHQPRSDGAVLLIATFGVFTLASAVLFAFGQAYLPCKLLVTVGVLWLLLIVVGIDRLSARAPRWGARLGGVTAVGLVVCNLASTWFDNSLWLLPLYHPVLYRARTHVGVLTEDLRELERAAAAQPAPGSGAAVVALGDDECARGSDRDRVLTAHVDNIFARYNVLHDPAADVWPSADPAWVLVFRGHGLPPAVAPRARQVIENTMFALYAVAANPACETALRPTE